MADSSFDIVSKVDKQEVANALNTASKEIATRYDFKGVGASLESRGESILIKANTEERGLAVLDVFQTWLVKREASRSSTSTTRQGREAEPRLSGKEYRLEAALKEGIDQENAKKIAKIIRDEGPKTVKSQIQGDELRVTSKSRDDLQAVQTMLRGAGPRHRAAVHQLPLVPGFRRRSEAPRHLDSPHLVRRSVEDCRLSSVAAARVRSSAVGHRCAYVLSVIVADECPSARRTVTTSQPGDEARGVEVSKVVKRRVLEAGGTASGSPPFCATFRFTK